MCTLPAEDPKLPIKIQMATYPKIPLFQYIEKEADVTPESLPYPELNRHTRALKWFLNGRYSGAWVVSVDDETDFDKLATALYVARRIRRSKFWAWWYKTFYSVKSYFVHERGYTGEEWPGNLS